MNRRSAIALAGTSAFASVIPVSAKSKSTPTPVSSTQLAANTTIAGRWVKEVWNGNDMSVIDEIVSPNFVPSNDNDAPGIDALKQRISQKIQSNTFAVNNITYTMATGAAQGAYVFLRGDLKGTSSQGKKIDANFFMELKFSGGLIVSEWSLIDQTALFGG